MKSLENPLKNESEKPKRRLFGSDKTKESLSVRSTEKEDEGLLYDFEGIKLNKESYGFVKELEAIMREIHAEKSDKDETKLNDDDISEWIGRRLIQEDGTSSNINKEHALVKISLSNFGLTSLPDLPSTLQVLHCFDNPLTSLPNLPPNLKELWCSNNKLTSLPELPQTLEELYCSGNKLTVLNLPSSVRSLNCSNNPLSAETLKNLREHKNYKGFAL